MSGVDRWIEGRARGAARHLGRRTFIARMGTWLIGASALPLLPVARRAHAAPDEDIDGPEGDPKSCDYWRHCGIDGSPCACCGGSVTSCPPGTETSPVTWVGTCRNPKDGKDYLIAYNDCCGRTFCGRCMCNRNEGERPEYDWYRNNDINWCAASSSQVYNCSLAVVIGEASATQPEK